MSKLAAHILDATGRLAPLKAQILETLAQAEAAAAGITEVPRADVGIRDWPDRAMAHDGVGGSCPRPHEIEIALDPGHPALDLGENGGYERTIVHELHHLLRRQSVGYGDSLGEALVSEGLAGHFVAQVLGTVPEPWEVAVVSDDLARFAAIALEAWNSTEYDHGEWFFGSGALPLWLGYTLGFSIVGTYLGTHPARDAVSLTDTPATSFVARAEAISRGEDIR